MRIPYTLLVAASLCFLPTLTQAQTQFAFGTPSAATELARMEQAVVSKINIIRIKNGLRALKANTLLGRAAAKHSQNMASRNFFDHNDPQGRDVAARVRAERYEWQSVGENIAMNAGYENPVTVAVDGWMKSQGHRENILRGHYTETGVGVIKVANRYYFTQVFGTPRR